MCRENSKSLYNLTRITGTARDDVFTFLIISQWIILVMRNVADRSFRENQNTHFYVQ